MSDEKPTRELIITSCVERKRGGGGTTGKKEWVLYTVGATNVDGIPVDLELRSWVKLEAKGSPQDFFVEHKEFNGDVTYELTPIRKLSTNDRLERLERQVLELREEMSRLNPEPTGEAGAPAGPAGGGAW